MDHLEKEGERIIAKKTGPDVRKKIPLHTYSALHKQVFKKVVCHARANSIKVRRSLG